MYGVMLLSSEENSGLLRILPKANTNEIKTSTYKEGQQ